MQKDEEVGKVAQATPVVICCVVPAIITRFPLLQNPDSQSVGDVPRDVGGGIEQSHGFERVKEGGSVSPVSPLIWGTNLGAFY